jgi:hypothetical protein
MLLVLDLKLPQLLLLTLLLLRFDAVAAEWPCNSPNEPHASHLRQPCGAVYFKGAWRCGYMAEPVPPCSSSAAHLN